MMLTERGDAILQMLSPKRNVVSVCGFLDSLESTLMDRLGVEARMMAAVFNIYGV